MIRRERTGAVGGVLIAAFAGLASGCSSNGGAHGSANGGAGGAGGAIAPPADALAFCGALHAVEVDRIVACEAGHRGPLAASYGVPSICSEVTDSVALGTITFDRDQASACLEWLAHLPCGHAMAPPSSAGPCDRALVGQVADGGACAMLDSDLRLSDCARTSWCDWSMTCPGVCRPYTKLGQPCDFTTLCERGAYCGALRAGDPRTCVGTGGPGQSCDPSFAWPTDRDLRVGWSDSCVEGYHCDRDRAVCVPVSPIDPCKGGEQLCTNGYCRQELAGTDPSSGAILIREVCQPLSDGACALIDADGLSPYCPPGSRCDATYQCATFLLPGEACNAPDDRCADGFTCGASKTCELGINRQGGFDCARYIPCGHPGETCCFCATCSRNFNCGAGAICDGLTQKCSAG